MSEGILRHLVKARGLQDKVSTTIQGHLVIYCIYTKYSIYIPLLVLVFVYGER